MGIFGFLDCTCGYRSQDLTIGLVRRDLVEPTRCDDCGDFGERRTLPGHPEALVGPAEPDPCPSCGSSHAADAPDVVALAEDGAPAVPCPRCAAPLRWHGAGIAD